MSAPPKLEIFMSRTGGVQCRRSSFFAHVKITPSNEQEQHTPLDVVCVIDTSGSMNSIGSIQGTGTDTDNSENPQLSLLAITKHAVKTIIEVLGPNDTVALVEFNTNASEQLAPTPMNSAGKKIAVQKVNALRAQGTTNLWGGLQLGLNLSNQAATGRGPHRHKAVLLLTDGEPDRGSAPDSGYSLGVRKIRGHTVVHTFGFGYRVQSDLLREIAVEGQGMYSFIPDASFVGTAFVNNLSNMKVTVATDVRVLIETPKGTSVASVPGFPDAQVTATGATVLLGTMQLGQSRDLILRVNCNEKSFKCDHPNDLAPPTSRSNQTADDQERTISATVEYIHFTANTKATVSASGRIPTSLPLVADVLAEVARLSFCAALSAPIQHAMQTMEEVNTAVKSFIDNTTALQVELGKPHPLIVGVMADAQGQVLEALSRAEWYRKWGRHYLPSLALAHELQQCTNFKDPGLQCYGGVMFEQARDVADDVFLTLSPPTPDTKPSGVSAQMASVNMHSYHCSGNPCFHGETLVQMGDGTTKQTQLVRQHDTVMTANGRTARVVCVVKTICNASKAKLVRIPSANDLVRTDTTKRRDMNTNTGTDNHTTAPTTMNTNTTTTTTTNPNTTDLLVTPWHPVKSPTSIDYQHQHQHHRTNGCAQCDTNTNFNTNVKPDHHGTEFKY
eukprot:m.134714 g.134714  ORF g.134714 m.134714 type:complete len:673 (-) comp29755_c0_seq1:365-2383(-)